MKIVSQKRLAGGKRLVVLELDATEPMPVQQYKADAFYRLGEPLDDVVQGHILAAAHQVHWCPIEQRWYSAK